MAAVKQSEMSDADLGQYGWDAAVNLVTPLPRRNLAKRRIVFWAMRRSWLINLLHRLDVSKIRPVDDQLRRLNHLHFARWSVVKSFPRPGDADRESWRHRLVLFTSYFDFGWRRYLGTFIETTGDGLGHLWGDVPTWRGAGDGFRQFENFVVAQQVPHSHLYAAFPGHSCNDVRAALRIKQEFDTERIFDELVESLDVDADGDGSSEQGAVRRRRALLRRLQHCLGSVSDGPDHSRNGASDPVDRVVRQDGLTCLVPYRHRHHSQLHQLFGALDIGPESPFARLPGTHFARMALIGEEHFTERSVPPLANGYLLVSAELDGNVDEWLAKLKTCTELDPIWALCHGYTGPASLPDLLRECRIAPSLQFIDYPCVSVETISEAIAVAKQLPDLVEQLAQGRPHALRQS